LYCDIYMLCIMRIYIFKQNRYISYQGGHDYEGYGTFFMKECVAGYKDSKRATPTSEYSIPLQIVFLDSIHGSIIEYLITSALLS